MVIDNYFKVKIPDDEYEKYYGWEQYSKYRSYLDN